MNLGQLIRFFKDAAEELKKVTWYSRVQMIQSTALVVILVSLFAVYVGVMDKVIQVAFAAIIVRRI